MHFLTAQIHNLLCAASFDGDTDVEIAVAFLSNNSPDFLLSFLACTHISSLSMPLNSKSRFTILPTMLNTRWTHEEIKAALSVPPSSSSSTERQQKRQHVTLICHGNEFQTKATQAALLLSQSCSISLPVLLPNFTTTPHSSLSSPPPLHSIQTTNILNNAVLLYTSGTSSLSTKYASKAVSLSHSSLHIQSLAKTKSPCNYSSSTTLIASTVPFFHVGGLSSALAILCTGGGTLVFPFSVGTSSFDPKSILQTMEQTVNTLVVVPAMIQSMLLHLEKTSSNKKYRDVQLILVGGSSLSFIQRTKLRMIFPNAKIVQTYACTEAASSITFLDVTKEEKEGAIMEQEVKELGGTCVGTPPPHVHIGIFVEELSSQTPVLTTKPYTIGIIGTQGPHTMNGYYTRTTTTTTPSFSPTSKKWYLTNDLGYIDIHSKLYFCGRNTDTIRTGGETVYAPEVEHVLSRFSDLVNECIVFGLEDEYYGEVVSVAIVPTQSPKPRTTTTEVMTLVNGTIHVYEDTSRGKEIKMWCQQHNLAGYKIPKRVFVLMNGSTFVRNSNGKVLKRLFVHSLKQGLVDWKEGKKKVMVVGNRKEERKEEGVWPRSKL